MKEFWLYFILAIVCLIVISVAITYPKYRKQMESAKNRIAGESRILNTENGVLEYAVRGEGKPILLIHGAGGGFDQGLWLGEICFDENFRFIAPSKFGYMKSSIPENASIKMQSEIYRVLLDHLLVDKVTVVGVSAGGPSAIQFANDYRERVDKLILLSAVSMPPNLNDKDPFFIRIIHLIQKSDYLYWLFSTSFETQILNLLGIPPDDYRNFTVEQKDLAKRMLEIMHPMSLRHNGTITDGLLISDFVIPKNIIVPTLIIHSKNDGLVSYSHAEYANKNIGGSRIILYENGGHGALSELENVRIEIKQFLILNNPGELIKNEDKTK